MKERDPEALSWTSRFTVIAFSFFAFSLFIKLIGSSPAHITLFLNIGFIATGLAVLSFLNNLTRAYMPDKKKDLSASPEHD
ncbi:MAG TPA: hypothetical protein VIZ28_00845 [Chitinophagaceae bacterium]